MARHLQTGKQSPSGTRILPRAIGWIGAPLFVSPNTWTEGHGWCNVRRAMMCSMTCSTSIGLIIARAGKIFAASCPNTGQRRGDLCRLAWSNYDGTRIRLTQGKTGTALVIPVHPVLKAAMDGWERVATTILVNSAGRPWQGDNVSHGLKYALHKLGFPKGWNVHGLRKLAATNLAEAGCSAHEIASITGHRSLAHVALYTASVESRWLVLAIHRLVKVQR